jgi:hypothetical protein
MADETEKGGQADGGASSGSYPPPMIYPGALPAPMGYPGMVYAPLAEGPDKTELKLSDAAPPQVRAELTWLVKTAKEGRMPVGVIATCYRLLILLLRDLERTFRPAHPLFLGIFPVEYESGTVMQRLRALRRAGAITRAVVDEARALRLRPRPPACETSYAGLLGDPAEATRFVAFLRMLVDVAYEARAKFAKNQMPAAKKVQGVAMTVTVGPPTSSLS